MRNHFNYKLKWNKIQNVNQNIPKDKDVVYIHINKHTDTHTHSGTLLYHKKRNFAICSNMDRLGGHYSKWNKSEKDKYNMVSLIDGI